MPSKELLRAIRRGYQLSWSGIHGVGHWARALENGVRLAASTGARLPVVRFFAVFHDACRVNDDRDPGHGRRGAALAESLRGDLFQMSDADFELLRTACITHTDGQTEADVTIQTCWDADRLDLGRVGIRPRPKYLCTPAAKDPGLIDWAYQRSLTRHIPEFVRNDWES